MRIPKNVYIIGMAEMLRYIPTAVGPGVKHNRTLSDHILACNRTYTTLFIFPNVPEGKKKARANRVDTKVRYKIPNKPLKRVGRMVSIQYCSDWWRGRWAKWEHVFDEPLALYADRYTRFYIMAIKARRTRKIVTEDGIEG